MSVQFSIHQIDFSFASLKSFSIPTHNHWALRDLSCAIPTMTRAKPTVAQAICLRHLTFILLLSVWQWNYHNLCLWLRSNAAGSQTQISHMLQDRRIIFSLNKIYFKLYFLLAYMYFKESWLFVEKKCAEFNSLGKLIQGSDINCSDALVTCPNRYRSTEMYKCKLLFYLLLKQISLYM